MKVKKFKTWEEALDHDYKNPGKSMYYAFQGENLPRVKGGINYQDWVGGQAIERVRGIYLEVTPLWVTITVFQDDGTLPMTKNVKRNRRPVNRILQEVFE